MRNLEELEQLIIEWAKARKIIPNASAETQMMKLYSEVGEFADAIIKGDLPEIKDAIGDMFVLSIVWNELKFNLIRGNSIAGRIDDRDEYFYQFIDNLNLLFDHSIRNDRFDARWIFNSLIDDLETYAEHYGFTLEECVNSAYEEIKDRKGTLLPNGVFVKEI